MTSTESDLTSEPVENSEESSLEVTEVKTEVKVQHSSPQFKNPASPYTALSSSIKEGVGSGPNNIQFFGPRFMTIWVMPIALTGILMEFLFVSPLRNINPFS